ncbi:hypothetical protein VKS41_006661 [Umbelopsis sp. WA50703]
MNISQPVGSEIDSVSFSFYDAAEIRKISVKQIVNPIIMDTMGHPTKGGLYDPALGPYSKRHICGTCSQDHFNCPGHFGHIELPVPAYNPIFFDNLYANLRAKCFYCHHYRMNRIQLHKTIAKLKLLQRGLIREAQRIDDFNIRVKKSKHVDEDDIADVLEEEQEGSETAEQFIERIDEYIEASINNKEATEFASRTYKITIINEERKQVMADFFRRCIAKKRCENCGGISPPVRKDGVAKIFQMPLTKKTQMIMDAKGMKLQDVLVKSPSKSDDMVIDPIVNDDNTNGTAEQSSSDESSSEEEEDRAEKMPKAKISKEEGEAPAGQQKYLTPHQIRDHMVCLFDNEKTMTMLMYGARNPRSPKLIKPVKASMFFIDVLAVAPTRFRPASVMGDKAFESPQNVLLGKILTSSQQVRESNTRVQSLAKNKEENKEEINRVFNYLVNNIIKLQHDVNSFIDSTKNPAPLRQGQLPPAGIRQTLEKKEGLFRKHMMGKRVNYAARSVISPDPNIETSEIGVPPVFAKTLTYPEPVTPYNVKEMMQAVINGPEKWPGATHVQYEDQSLHSLANLSVESRIALANTLLSPQDSTATASGSPYATRTQAINKKVFRHLRNGDMLLLNRQPTLHKPSIMAHKARVLPGEKTIRMHFANCNTYNADFDGDEMNIHFPQNEIARAEATLIANTDNQYLVPTSGSPLRGLIQDHVVAGVWMTSRDTFFTRDQYQQMLYGALRPERDGTGNGRIITVPPTVWKPVPLWTGKQVITTILKNLSIGKPSLNLKSNAKVGGKYWGPDGSEEATVLFMDGELLTGVLDKSQFGATAYGMVHSVYEIYGPESAGVLLSILGRLFTKFTQFHGFTCRMDDLRLTPEGDQWRRNLLDGGKTQGMEAHIEFLGLTEMAKEASEEDLKKEFDLRMEEVARDDNKLAGLDNAMKSKVNKLTSSVIDRCIPNGLVKKFPKNNMQMMTVSGAKGSPVNVSQISCLLGQQELEGRRVPLMVSGKSLPSFLPYESSARAGGYVAGRFLTGIRPQEYYFHCMAGREGLIDTAVKTSRSGYLQRCLIKHLEGLRVHYDHSVRDADGSILQFHYGEDSLDVIKQKHLYQFSFCANNSESLLQKYNPKAVVDILDMKEGSDYNKKAFKKQEKYDPALSKYSPSRHLGVVSELFTKELNNYMEKNPDNLPFSKSTPITKNNERFAGVTKSKFKALMHLKYLHSLVEPGEAVGLLAAQSVGEPSTQMTLNTFHFAGFGAANVTLGIPRLREIIMTASATIKTPTMMLPLLPNVTDEKAKQFCKNASRLTLAQIVDDVIVTERMTSKASSNMHRRSKVYQVRLNLFSEKEYKEEYNVSARRIKEVLESKFISRLETVIRKDIKDSKKAKADDVGRAVKRSKSNQATEDDSAPVKATVNDEDEGDGDATDVRNAKRSAQHASYDAPDEDDEEVIKAMDQQMDEELELDALAEKDDDEKEDAMEVDDSEDRILNNTTYVSKWKFDNASGAWCEFELTFPANTKKILMVALVEKICHEVIVHEIKGISRCFPYINPTENDKSRKLQTEGVNLKGLWQFADIIDVSCIDTNDIAAVLRTYGVEAARNAIMKEVAGVFGVYGISVDKRHLSLIAEYMTFEGGYKPFNRSGIESNVSPFLKMSFERTCHFLTEATIHGDYDSLDNPSSKIVMGKVVGGGTGSFEVMQPLVDTSA